MNQNLTFLQIYIFRNPKTLLTLFSSLVRSNLEYGSLLWSSSSIVFCDKVERMQRNFLRFLDFYQSDCSYYDLCKKFNVDTLHLRRMVSSIMFCFDVITSKIDCSAILSQINFNCASRSLHFNEFLRSIRHVTNYAMSEPINVIMYDFNLVSDLFDFGLDRNQFEQLVKIRLKELL